MEDVRRESPVRGRHGGKLRRRQRLREAARPVHVLQGHPELEEAARPHRSVHEARARRRRTTSCPTSLSSSRTSTDDMHNGTVADGDTWLKNNIEPLLSSPALGNNGVVFVVFDEAEDTDTTGGGGHVDVLALGPAVDAGLDGRHADEPLRPAPHDRGRLEAAAARRSPRRRRRSPSSGSKDPAGIGARAGNPFPRCSSRSHARSKSATASSVTARASRLSRSPSRLRLGWERERVRTLRTAAPLHDIGKVKMRPQVLSKPGPLTPEERHEVAGASEGRRAARPAAPPLPRRAPVRAVPPRALGRRRLSGRAARAAHSRRGARARRRGLLRRDDLRADVPAAADPPARRSRKSSAAPGRSSTRSSPSSSSRSGRRAGTPGSPALASVAQPKPRPSGSRRTLDSVPMQRCGRSALCVTRTVRCLARTCAATCPARQLASYRDTPRLRASSGRAR